MREFAILLIWAGTSLLPLETWLLAIRGSAGGGSTSSTSRAGGRLGVAGARRIPLTILLIFAPILPFLELEFESLFPEPPPEYFTGCRNGQFSREHLPVFLN